MSKTLLVVFAILLPLKLLSQTSIYNVSDFGAKGDGHADDAVAIQKAIDKCSQKGGGQVYFPSGHVFVSGPLKLKSNVDIHLDANSCLKANPDDKIYKLSAFGKNEGEGMMWIYSDGGENISITGKGTIDGNGISFMGAELSDSYELKPVTTFDPRPHVLTLVGIRNLTIRDVTIRNGAYWTVHLVGCNDVAIDGINLLNNLKIRNGDGIDIDHSRNVRIANCHITSGDDCICLKNRREFEQFGSCKDIVVTNCVMSSRSCAIKIGSENMDSISNVLIDNCIIKASNRGLGIQNRDEGTVTDVTFSNIQLDCRLWSDVWWGKAEPIYVTSYPRANGNNKDANWRFPKGKTEGSCGEVSRIFFNNITGVSENGCFIGGDTNDKVNHVYINNVNLLLHSNGQYKGGIYDKRPCKGEGFVSDKVYGIYIDNASDVEINGLKVLHEGIDFGGDVKRNEIEVVVHRGANHLAPENTVASALKAIEHGAKWIEVDVRSSKDGVLYNLHDATLDRTTNGKGDISQRKSDYIDNLDAGSWFDAKYQGVCVPRISDMMTMLQGKANIFFDVKDCNLPQLVQMVRAKGYTDKSFFWFGDKSMLEAFVKLAPEMKIKVNASDISKIEEWMKICKPSIIEVAVDNITDELRTYCHSHGIKIMAAVQGEDAANYEKAIDAKADMVNIDQPEVFQKIRHAR
jgi:hypothetical protein